jgi:hypothetical protein
MSDSARPEWRVLIVQRGRQLQRRAQEQPLCTIEGELK